MACLFLLATLLGGATAFGTHTTGLLAPHPPAPHAPRPFLSSRVALPPRCVAEPQRGDLKKWTKKQLQYELKAAGLSSSGNKKTLVVRLESALLEAALEAKAETALEAGGASDESIESPPHEAELLADDADSREKAEDSFMTFAAADAPVVDEYSYSEAQEEYSYSEAQEEYAYSEAQEEYADSKALEEHAYSKALEALEEDADSEALLEYADSEALEKHAYNKALEALEEYADSEALEKHAYNKALEAFEEYADSEALEKHAYNKALEALEEYVDSEALPAAGAPSPEADGEASEVMVHETAAGFPTVEVTPTHLLTAGAALVLAACLSYANPRDISPVAFSAAPEQLKRQASVGRVTPQNFDLSAELDKL